MSKSTWHAPPIEQSEAPLRALLDALDARSMTRGSTR